MRQATIDTPVRTAQRTNAQEYEASIFLGFPGFDATPRVLVLAFFSGLASTTRNARSGTASSDR
jgi:hypothetical protein